MDPVDALLELLVGDGGQWPPRRYHRRNEHIATMRAFLETDRDALRVVADWPKDRGYKVDALPSLIADAWADHLFGADPTITPSDDRDTNALGNILEGNDDLVGRLHAAERTVAGEGETWWRIYRDDELADVPLLDWHDADTVYPFYIAGRLLAAAVVTELEPKTRRSRAVFRHFEVHAAGVVEHILFRGTAARIGQTVPLDQHSDTEDLARALGSSQAWRHGLPMLMGRVTNGRKRMKRLKDLGVSDFLPILDDLLDLNEAKTIAGENVRLTAKRRVIVPEDSLQPARPELVDRGDGILVPAPTRPGGPTYDAGEDVLVVSKLDAELGRGSEAPFKVLEYSFDAAPLLEHKRDLVESALTRVGLTPQYVGVVTGQGDGLALSGTALRLRLIPTTKAGAGKARPWDDTLPVVLSLMARLDALPSGDGGFDRGTAWADPITPPAVERADALPHDEVEDATIESTLVTAGVRSRRTSVKAQHPDWTDEQVDEELAAIKDDAPSASSVAAGGLGSGAGL